MGKEERLSSSKSEALSVAPPKLLVFDITLLAVSSVYGNILFLGQGTCIYAHKTVFVTELFY